MLAVVVWQGLMHYPILHRLFGFMSYALVGRIDMTTRMSLVCIRPLAAGVNLGAELAGADLVITHLHASQSPSFPASCYTQAPASPPIGETF